MTTNRYTPRPGPASASARHLAPPGAHGLPGRAGAPTPPPRHRPWTAAGTALACLAASAAAYQLWKPKPGPQSACVIGIDAQGSASVMAPTYRSWLSDEAEMCAGKSRGVLHVALVSGETSTGTVTPVSTDLGKLDYTGNATNDEKILKSALVDAVKQTDTAILAAPMQSGGTDVLGIICVAHDLMRGHTPSTLILNSDAMNGREPYRMASMPLDPSSIAKAVARLKADGQLCDLHGADVYLYGVGIGKGTDQLSARRLAAFHTFWAAVFHASNAHLVAYQRNP